jgi:hypothetical protein
VMPFALIIDQNMSNSEGDWTENLPIHVIRVFLGDAMPMHTRTSIY